MNTDPKSDSKDAAKYSPPEILELGDADALTHGQDGPKVDADAQKSPDGPIPAADHP
jgi:hypothetical protein